MKRGVLGIYDYETDYANNLMEYLNRKSGFAFETRVFTRIESISEYTKCNVIELLLVSEDVNLKQVENNNIKWVLKLSETKKKGGECVSIYKFQSMENIICQILTYYMDNTEAVERQFCLQGNNNAQVIGIFSPAGGSYNTTFSIALGQAMAERTDVLYINLEVIPGLFNWNDELPKAELSKAGLSDLLYYVNQKKEGLSLRLRTMVQKIGNLYCLPPVDSYLDLWEMEISDLKELLNQIKTESEYNFILLDIGFIGSIFIELLKLCDRIYLPSPYGRMAKEKQERFMDVLKRQGENDLINKLIVTEIPFDGHIASGDYDIMQLCSGELGNYIYKLLGEENERERTDEYNQK